MPFPPGIFIFLADAMYISQLDSFPITDTMTLFIAFELIAAAIFAILDLLGVKPKTSGKPGK